MKKLCISAIALVLIISVFTGCGCTNRRKPAGMMPTEMTTVPTTAATTAPTTAPTTTPTEKMTIPTENITPATGDMNTDATNTTGTSAPTDTTGTTGSGARSRTIR